MPIFFSTNNVTSILENISLTFGKKIVPGQTLLYLVNFIDKIEGIRITP